MLDEGNFSPPAFAAVAIPVPVNSQGILTYRVPEPFRARLAPGSSVIVPVGRRKITGIVTTVLSADAAAVPENVKDILDIFDEDVVFPTDLLQLWQWAAEYYCVSPALMLRAVFPRSLRRDNTHVVRLKAALSSPGCRSDAEGMEQLSESERTVFSFIQERKKCTVKALQRQFSSPVLHRALEKLVSLELVTIGEHVPQRRLWRSHGEAMPSQRNGEVVSPLPLSAAQQQAYLQVAAAVHAQSFRVFLLHGVAGSGKTEVYLRAAQDALTGGRTVLLLVPEIGLTHQLVIHVRQRFGSCVAVLHSGLVGSERWREWRRIARGEAKVVIGVRSAVFAPLARLGLIVVDEEHDTAYKQEEGVRYNARDVAIMRGKLAACPVVLSSATPSLESYVQSRAGRYTVLTLPERIAARQFPRVSIVDLRQEVREEQGNKIFSAVLREALLANYHAGRQSLLFLNRRGYANYLQCQLCGMVFTCSRCSVTLTFHLQDRILRCHYCGLSRHAPAACPQCAAPTLIGGGLGTEQVEEAVRTLLPHARIARLDRDSTSRQGVLARVLTAWGRHELDVLIGTQMITKGHDVPQVTLVGIILADLSLHLPDFRAAERTFQLLTQVAGRAGRGQERGRVIIQTYVPQHYSIRCAARHDFARFASQELRHRRQFGYPPFTRLVNIRIEGREEDKVQEVAEWLVGQLQTFSCEATKAPVILGPAPAPIERMKNRTRWQVLLKDQDRMALHAVIRHCQHELLARQRTHGVRTLIDVDPYSML
ncbi:MAG: primosomal protein N' [Candidatus Binatia bacterium]|nr:primosomal protein N' [Candidatus Binatia bacterium]